MNKICYFIAGFIGLLVTTGCSSKKETEGKKSIVRVEKVKVADAEGVLQYPGRVVSNADVGLSFRVPGQLKRVLVGEGDRVKAGQLIAELDDTDYRTQLDATKAEYDQVKADAERVTALYKEEGTTASNYDKARYGLEQVAAKLKNHRNQLSYTKLYAPCSGYIQRKFFDANETVSAGMPIVSMLGDGGLEVEINLPAAMYVRRNQLKDYECTFDVLPGKVLNLQFISILPNANSNQLYTIRLRLQDQSGKVAAGMSCWVKVHTEGNSSNHLVVPSTALLSQEGGTFVFLYDQSNHMVKRIPVTVEELHTDGTAVISGDMADDARVVTSGVHHIKDGERVELLAPVSNTNVGGLL